MCTKVVFFNYFVDTHFEEMGVAFRTFIFVGQLIFNFSLIFLSLMIITRLVGE
jgi:hypothetical protein